MWAKKSLWDALACEVIGRYNGVGAGLQQVFLGPFLARARNDGQLRIESSRREHNVEIGRVRGRSSDQPTSTFNVDLTKRLLLGCVSYEYQPIVAEPCSLSVVLLEDDKRHRLAGQFPRSAPANPPDTADDVVISKPVYLSLHLSPSEEFSQRKF